MVPVSPGGSKFEVMPSPGEAGGALTTATLVFFFFMRRTREAIWMVKRVSEKSLGEAEM